MVAKHDALPVAEEVVVVAEAEAEAVAEAVVPGKATEYGTES